ncbi:MAG: YqgE/AlgH family protein [Bacteroidetes bacterium]|nr:YqgE/AlgH family protein [Bacteroidota bacterium]
MTDLHSGQFLIADPFLSDPNFQRTVVLLSEYSSSLGSMGFVLNMPCELTLGELMSAMIGYDFPVFIGGPVQKDLLFFVHQCKEASIGGKEIFPGVFWGGDLNEAFEKIKCGLLKENRIKFFLGYSGWSVGQLEQEMELKSWITVDATASILFNSKAENTWSDALKEKGGDYTQLIHYPIDPILN